MSDAIRQAQKRALLKWMKEESIPSPREAFLAGWKAALLSALDDLSVEKAFEAWERGLKEGFTGNN